mgnify:CR=1 FL=1
MNDKQAFQQPGGQAALLADRIESPAPPQHVPQCQWWYHLPCTCVRHRKNDKSEFIQ